MLIKVIRAWGLSVLAWPALVAVWAASQALAGRWDTAGHNALDIATAFGGVFAVVAATLHVPMFVMLTLLTPASLTRTIAASVGILLAPVVYFLLVLAMRDSGDPETFSGWVQYWTRNPRGFLVGVAPFAVAGAIFGLAWVWSGPQGRTRRSPVV